MSEHSSTHRSTAHTFPVPSSFSYLTPFKTLILHSVFFNLSFHFKIPSFCNYTTTEIMKPIDEKKDRVTIRAVSRDEEGKKRVEKAEIDSHNIDTIKYIEKKLIDKGVQRLERHPVHGHTGIAQPPPKSGRGGKFTWEGPGDAIENELSPAPAAIDEKDPNYVDEVKEEEEEVAGLLVGEVEVPAAAAEGVSRVEVDPQLQLQ